MCFSMGGIEYFLLWLLAVCFVIGVLKILVPWILELAGIAVSGRVAQLINLCIVFLVIAAVIIVLFWLISCAMGGGFGFHLAR